ncbi:MAG TPA: polyketide cyclase, partial [Verrucomicrobiae bacterium]
MTVEIILALALLVAIFIVLVSLRSDKYLVERSLLIAAPASTLFPLVNDHQNFNRWNPFLKMDPQVKNTL